MGYVLWSGDVVAGMDSSGIGVWSGDVAAAIHYIKIKRTRKKLREAEGPSNLLSYVKV